ncbi:hypothetical protein DRW48_10305 [Paracoccus suum]|uniref:Uncharacterized protein n=1 Tax=Paracoccus suum TaxID=2259340 RepID=A0A344PKX4_9RHOB|nr:hypothetical protein [Paracoccus suum]AXC50029.1 hypothetical protein DRW48_10305 [Paracoccus suum]
MTHAIPSENAIVDAIHKVAELAGYDPEILPEVARLLAPKDADEDERGIVSAAVQAVWRTRFNTDWGG